MFFEDLSGYCYYLKTPLANVLNVGWLEKYRPYAIGKIRDGFLLKLSSVILGNEIVDVNVNRIRSMHSCSLCDCDTLVIEVSGRRDYLGAAEIWIPSIDGMFYWAAPSMIYHYVEKHNYLPPKEFIDAVMAFDLAKPFIAQDVYLEEIKGHF